MINYHMLLNNLGRYPMFCLLRSQPIFCKYWKIRVGGVFFLFLMAIKGWNWIIQQIRIRTPAVASKTEKKHRNRWGFQCSITIHGKASNIVSFILNDFIVSIFFFYSTKPATFGIIFLFIFRINN